MTEKPILFTGENVRSILEGRKTQTRRVIKPQPVPIGTSAVDRFEYFDDGLWLPTSKSGKSGIFLPSKYRCPYGTEGNRLWVRENWATTLSGVPTDGIAYKADYPADRAKTIKWKSPIHMPRWASRITLKVLNIRVERIQQITARECWAEGIERICEPSTKFEKSAAALDDFMLLWNRINGPRGFGWDVNPWVWVVEFKKMS